jgi:hypothetical protein
MLYEKFIRLVEDHAEILTRNWIHEVTNNPATPGYKLISRKVLEERAFDDYKRLGRILLREDASFKSSAEHYIKLGKARAKEGLKASEVVYALILSRVVLWKFIINEGVINSTMDLHQALTFYQKVNNFYDKAAYFITVGYENLNVDTDDILKQGDFIEKAVSSVTKWFMRDLK